MSVSGDLLVPPDPAALIESMRAFGYSLPTAIADLVDNSISAGSRNIDIEFVWEGESSSVMVRDDGAGMGSAELVEAMRLGSKNPTELRDPRDLGRFGLGLKSAAWSQARSLTVISSAGGLPETRRWDLDHVTKTGEWSLLQGGSNRAADLAGDLDGHGTIVLLERPDRLIGEVTRDDEDAQGRFLALVSKTSDHLGMTFHRFLAGPRAITINVNGHRVEPWDPFLANNPATQTLPDETLHLAMGRVSIVPYVLPHVSKLSDDEHSNAAGMLGWNAQQGFYVYRARRLLVAGGWLGLPRMQQEEHYKLARVQVDLDNDMDEQWQIDVRKATARIPGNLQDTFKRIAKRARTEASNAYRFRGKTVARSHRQKTIDFVWQRKRLRDGAQVFRVNRNHPLVSKVDPAETPSDAVEQALRLVEENLPIEAIVMDSREQPDERPRRPYEGDEVLVARMLEDAHAAMTASGTESGLALRALASVEPFESYPELIQTLKERIER